MNQMVTNKQQLISRLLENKLAILNFGVAKIGLFGSFVRDKAMDSSDVDLLVEFAPGMKSYDNFIELAYFLEEILGRKIDLLTTQSLSPHIGPSILQEVESVVAA